MPVVGDTVVIDAVDVGALLEALGGWGTVHGPTVRDGAVVIAPIDGVDDLPAGVGDEQGPGRYRLTARGDGALFGYAVGPHAARSHLQPPRELLFTAHRGADGFEVDAPPAVDPVVLFGVRPCDVRAMEVQDRVMLDGAHPDEGYRARRESALVAVAQCTDPSATCACTAMGGGPRATGGFDLAVTELLDGAHRLVVEVGSERGATTLDSVAHRPATTDEVAAARSRTDAAAARMSERTVPPDLPGLLAATLEHPRWDDVAERCLTCANCTLVCPTCFCTTVEDTTDLTGDHAERWRRWESCFTLEHSHLAAGPVRASARSRYRQWLTHKFGTWWDQFGESGCVGCGRCTTWCPVGIDVVEELAALAAAPSPVTSPVATPVELRGGEH